MPAEFVSGVTRTPAWHGLSKVTGELLTIPDALVQSKATEQVTKLTPVYIQVGTEYVKVDGYNAITDVNNPNWVGGIHQGRYVNKDVSDVFMPIHAALEQLGRDTKLVESLCMLRDNKIACMTLLFPELEVQLADKTAAQIYLNALTSHDGSYSADYRPSAIRQVCCNTVAMSQAAGGARWRAKHTENMDDQIKAAVSAILNLPENVQAMVAMSEKLLGIKIADSEFDKILNKLIPMPKEDGKGKTMAVNRQFDIWTIYNHADDQQDIKGTAWGVYNAFSAYSDHFARYNNTKNATAAENRMLKSLSGDTLANEVLALFTNAKSGIATL